MTGSRKWPATAWRHLLELALRALDAEAAETPWTFGGGTALALKLRHRISYDVDIFFEDDGLSVGRIGILAAIYPAVWGLGQLYTGSLSDRIGRKPLIAGGMLTQAVAIAWISTVSSFWPWAVGAGVLGAGTAMAYPALLAAIGDVAHPSWRARSVGIYRLWRDAGFAVGAIVAGLLADLISIQAAIYAVAALTAVSGFVVMGRMYETHAPAARSTVS